MSLILNPAGAVCDVAPSNQLTRKESQDMCGPWTVSGLKFAGLPGHGALASGAGTENPIDDWAEAEYEKHIGPNTASDSAGSSIENMHQFFHDAGNLHYFDIEAISPNSQQSSDLAHIRAALAAGYPVAVTVGEQSVVSKRLGRCPYPWQPGLGDVNHLLPIVGIDKDGDFIVADQLNSFEAWPQTYLAGPIACRWASIVQLVGPDAANPWLKPIPSGDPTSWPAGFNAQAFAEAERVQINMAIPKDWSLSSDKLTLTAPNGGIAVQGFMKRILSTSNWDPACMPLEREHGVPTGGTQQLFTQGKMLLWNAKDGVTIGDASGLVLEQRVQIASQQQQINALQQQVSGLIAQVKAEQATIPAEVVSALTSVLHSMAETQSAIQFALNAQPPAPALQSAASVATKK